MVAELGSTRTHCTKKGLPDLTPGGLLSYANDPRNNDCHATELLLWRCRRLWRCCARRWGPRSCGRGLGRVALVEQANNILRHVHRIRREDYRRSLPGTIENDGERVVAGVLAQHVNHPAADAVHNLTLRFVEIILCVLRSPLERALELLALALQPRFFIVAQRGLAGAQTRLNILHLLLHVRKLSLPGCKLRLQFRCSLLPFRRAGDRYLYVNDAYLTCYRGGRSAARLRPHRGNHQERRQGRNCKSHLHSHSFKWIVVGMPVPGTVPHITADTNRRL